MQLSISNVVRVSVSQPGAGLGRYNTSNVALFSDETPLPSFGDDGYKMYIEPSEVAEDFGSQSTTYKMALKLFSQQPNIRANRGYLVVFLFDEAPYTPETLEQAILRTSGWVQYFGIMSTRIESEQDVLDAASLVQTLNKMLFVVSNDPNSVESAGTIDLLRSGGFFKTRGLFYGAATDLEALEMMGAYVGRGLSVNFQGSNTTLTMHMKDLLTIQPDPSMTQSLLQKCKAAGADVYASFEGVPKVFCSGANQFFDYVYNLGAFIGDVQVAGFNFLAQSATKIPQTEQGMDALKSTYDRVAQQYVRNQMIAPGSWTRPDTFGDQLNFFNNIETVGYYIYSQPIAQQDPVDRADRIAPLVQIAIKLAGAIHESDVLIYVDK